MRHDMVLLVKELSYEILLILPLAAIYSHFEKRFLIQCKQPVSYCKLYRTTGFIALYIFIVRFVPRPTPTTNTEDQEVIHIISNTSRICFAAMGIYLGLLFRPIAITGSIATGKSTVVKMLLEMSVDVSTTATKVAVVANRTVKVSSKTKKLLRIIDTDSIAHDILLSPSQLSSRTSLSVDRLVHINDSVYTEILKAFGDMQINNKNILSDDTEIDRRKLGDIIFQDRSKRLVLNRITHPQIIRIMMQHLLYGSYARRNEAYICADVPLLYESGLLRWLFSCVIVVACSPDIQYERLHKRNPDLTETQCRQRITSQIPIEQKVSRADLVIWNNGSFEDLSNETQRATNELRRRMQNGQFSWVETVLILGVFIVSTLILSLF